MSAVKADNYFEYTKWTLEGQYKATLHAFRILWNVINGHIKNQFRNKREQQEKCFDEDNNDNDEEDNFENDENKQRRENLTQSHRVEFTFEVKPPPPPKNNNVPIVHGIRILSSLSTLTLGWAPYSLLDLRIGMIPTRFFAISNHILGLLGFVLSCYIIRFIYGSTIKIALPGINGRISTAMTFCVVFSQVSFMACSVFSINWIIWKRKFLHDFFIIDCAHINVDKSYQTKKIVQIFITRLVFSILNEPVFLFYTLYRDMSQPRIFPNLSSGQFLLLKIAMITFLEACAICLSFLFSVIPIMTCYISCCLDKHLDKIVQEQMIRVQEQVSSIAPIKKLEQLANKESFFKGFAKDYSIDTFCFDWPDIDQQQQQNQQTFTSYIQEFHGRSLKHYPSQSAVSLLSSSYHNVPNRKSLPINLKQTLQETIYEDQDEFFVPGSRLFVYRNLLKILSEQKNLIRHYEQVFGNFHQLLVYIEGWFVAQWLVSGLMEVRLAERRSGQMKIQSLSSDSNEARFYISSGENWLILLFCYNLVVFVGGNISLFNEFGRLPERLRRIRAQMFKLNIRLSKLDQSSCAQSKNLKKYTLLTKNSNTFNQELDLLWISYNTLQDMSKVTNFRFGSGNFYGKGTLIRLIGQEVSMILIYIQILDLLCNV